MDQDRIHHFHRLCQTRGKYFDYWHCSNQQLEVKCLQRETHFLYSVFWSKFVKCTFKGACHMKQITQQQEVDHAYAFNFMDRIFRIVHESINIYYHPLYHRQWPRQHSGLNLPITTFYSRLGEGSIPGDGVHFCTSFSLFFLDIEQCLERDKSHF